MKKTEILYNLIKKMTQSEKRYFNLYATRHIQQETTQYLNLFHCINNTKEKEVYIYQGVIRKKKVFQEEVIFNKLDKTFNKKNLKNQVWYLYKLIINSLEFFHVNRRGKFHLRHLLNEIELLLAKNLTEVARERITVAKKIAKSNHDFYIFQELISLERKLIRRYERKNVSEQLEVIKNEGVECLNSTNKYFDILNLYDKLHISILHRNAPNTKLDKTLSEIETLIEEQNFSNNIPSFDLHYLGALATIGFNFHYYHKNLESALQYLKSGIQLFELDKKLIQIDPDRYISFLYNYAIISLQLGQFDEILQLVSKIRKVSPNDTTGDFFLKLRIFQQTYRIELTLNHYEKRFDETLALVSNIEKGMEEFGNDIPPMIRATFYHNIALAFFNTNQFELALDWINKILILEKLNDLRAQVQLFTRLLQIMIHYDLQNFGVVAEYLVPSFLQMIKKFKTKRILIREIPPCQKFVRGIRNSCFTLKEKRKEIFENLRLELNPFWFDTEFSELLTWLERKE